MRTIISFFVLCLFAVSLTACGGSGSGGFFSSGSTPVDATYFSEFSDIPIPRDMKEVLKKTYLVINSDGSRSGTQTFEGSVELQSLMTAMLYNMIQQGWVPRSVFKGERCAMVFEKGASIAVITGSDGTLRTTMELWVAKRIQDGAMQMPEIPSDNMFLAPLTEGAL